MPTELVGEQGVTVTKDPYSRLLEHFEAAPRLAGSGVGVELTAAGAAVLLEGAVVESLAHALFDFWTDFEHGYWPQARLLLAALTRSVELWRSIPAGAHVDRHVVEALDRMFAAIHPDPARLRAALPPGAEEALLDALLSHIERISSPSTPLHRMEMNWVTLANSMVSVWPTSFDRAMAPVLRCMPTTWRSTLRYLVCIAFPTSDNPWSDEPCLLWDRFGADDPVRWTSATADGLEEALSTQHVESLVAEITGLLADQDEQESREAKAVCEEMLVLRLEEDFAIRRRILIQKLLTPRPGRFWDDEYGG